MSASRALLPRPRQMLWALFAAIVVVGIGIGILYARTSIPSPSVVASQQTTTIYASNGKSVIATLGSTNRTDVALSDVPIDVQHAVLAAEDRHFYSEPGVSPTGILRALYVDLRGGDVTQGGSTITQQYAKNAYLTQQRSLSRKLREIVIATKLGQSRSKASILGDYLNTIYLGRGAYGIQAAARAYFGVNASQLSTAQGALLAGIIDGPSIDDPAVNKGAALARWHYVIAGMVSQGWLSQSRADSLHFPKTEKPSKSSGATCSGNNCFIQAAVVNELEATDGLTPAQVELGGLKIVTTIDRTAQKGLLAAEQSVLPTQNANQESGAVSVKPGSGAIEAMYGGNKYCGIAHDADACLDKSGVGSTLMSAPVGSSMKVFTLIAALQSGISLNSIYNGPYEVDVDGDLIHNAGVGETCYGCTLTKALAQSVNTIFVPLAKTVGPDKIIQVAREAGIPSARTLSDFPDITLGPDRLSPLDLANAYATIAADGMRATPYLVSSVTTNDGTRLYTEHQTLVREFSPTVMSQVTYAMRQVLATGGTAAGRGLADGRPAAGKTGTTDNNSSVWFTGFTPQLCTSVWVGNVSRTKPLAIAGSGEVFGGTIPAEIWQSAMNAALANDPIEEFPVVTGVIPATPNPTMSSTSPTPTPTDSLPTPTPTGSLPGSTPTPVTTPTGVLPSNGVGGAGAPGGTSASRAREPRGG